MRPWYPFYPSDYQSDTKFISPMADLVYRRLLDLYWMNQGPIPLNYAAMARAIGLDTRVVKRYLHGELKDKWVTSDAHLHNVRMDAEIEKSQEIHDARVKAGQSGGLAKAKAKAKAKALAPQSQSQSHTKEEVVDIKNISTTLPAADVTKNKKSVAIPYKKIVESYHENLPDARRVNVISDKRKGHIRTIVRKHGMNTLKDWDKYFKFCNESKFLAGKSAPIPPRTRPFMADFDWLINENNLIKISEGKYHGN